MNLDSREKYFAAKRKLMQLTDSKLEDLLAELSDEVYVYGNSERKEYHRMASSVYNKRRGKGTTLIFHLKKFIPV